AWISTAGTVTLRLTGRASFTLAPSTLTAPLTTRGTEVPGGVVESVVTISEAEFPVGADGSNLASAPAGRFPESESLTGTPARAVRFRATLYWAMPPGLIDTIGGVTTRVTLGVGGRTSSRREKGL